MLAQFCVICGKPSPTSLHPRGKQILKEFTWCGCGSCGDWCGGNIASTGWGCWGWTDCFIEKIRYYMVVLLKHFTKHSDNATGTNKTLQIEICLRLKLTILLPTGKQNALLIKKHSWQDYGKCNIKSSTNHMRLLPQVDREKDTSSIAMSPAKLLPLRPSITIWKEKKSNYLSTFIYLQQHKQLIICINYVLYNGQKKMALFLPIFMPRRKIKLNSPKNKHTW